jgi:hypothetical protein
MAKKPKPKADKQPEPTVSERDQPVKIDLDPEATLRALVQVAPDESPATPRQKNKRARV